MATIYDVAARAGVSIKTVSRVMNAEPNVRAQTCERVLAAAASLDYHPNLSARSLAGSKSFLIAIVVDEKLTVEHWQTGLGADYLARIQLGAFLPCRAAGYHPFITLVDHGAADVRQELLTMLATLRPDGVILTPPSSDSEAVLGVLRDFGTPHVRLGPERPGGGGRILRLDDRAAAMAMVEHLVSLGHRRIGFIGGDERYGSSHARREGFLAAMSAHGLRAQWTPWGDYTFQSGLTCGRAMLRRVRRPTAIFASNDDMALGCMAAADDMGLHTPHDISIAGFDDSGGSRLSRPPLTTLRQPIAEMAALAVRYLIEGRTPAACDSDDAADLPPFVLLPRLSTATLREAPGKRA